MKHLLPIAVILICFTSCQKDVAREKVQNTYLEKVKTALKDSISGNFPALDFARAVQSTINQDTSYLRIPFSGKSLKQEFVLLHTNNAGAIKRGRIISLAPRISTPGKPTRYDGAITIRFLGGSLQTESVIINGSIKAFDQESNPLQRNMVVPSPYTTLPEVVVVSTRFNDGSWSFHDYMSLQALFGDRFGSYTNFFSSVDSYSIPTDGGGGGGSLSGDNTGGSPVQDPPILIDFENQDTDPAIDIEKYLACFDAIPDAGAACTIEILTDIPVDSDPGTFFNWNTTSTGHVFIKLNKKNGSQSVQQSIGWYPQDGYKLLLPGGISPGKFVDNQHHEFNAGYEVSITAAQLRSAISQIKVLSKFIHYDVDRLNCTDFALGIFNHTVSPQDILTIPKHELPGTINPSGSNTPNGLYEKLKNVQQSGGTNGSKVNIPGVKGWVGASNGPCN